MSSASNYMHGQGNIKKKGNLQIQGAKSIKERPKYNIGLKRKKSIIIKNITEYGPKQG